MTARGIRWLVSSSLSFFFLFFVPSFLLSLSLSLSPGRVFFPGIRGAPREPYLRITLRVVDCALNRKQKPAAKGEQVCSGAKERERKKPIANNQVNARAYPRIIKRTFSDPGAARILWGIDRIFSPRWPPRPRLSPEKGTPCRLCKRQRANELRLPSYSGPRESTNISIFYFHAAGDRNFYQTRL